MQRQIIVTADGSHTISVPEMNVTYHSIHGAIQESRHVFINAGLLYVLKSLKPSYTIHILEIGLGTGLNALLSLIEAEDNQQQICYTAVEPDPLLIEEVVELNYCNQLNRPDLQNIFNSLHSCEWEKEVSLTPSFTIRKTKQSLLHFTITETQHLVYFDAFAPMAQPELWTKEVFENLYHLLSPNGVLVTYCSKGDVRRAMQSLKFSIEKLPGPPGKREMLRAKKMD